MRHPIDPQGTVVDGAPRVPAVRRRQPGDRSVTVERKLKTDIEAWLKERRSVRRAVPVRV